MENLKYIPGWELDEGHKLEDKDVLSEFVIGGPCCEENCTCEGCEKEREFLIKYISKKLKVELSRTYGFAGCRSFHEMEEEK